MNRPFALAVVVLLGCAPSSPAPIDAGAAVSDAPEPRASEPSAFEVEPTTERTDETADSATAQSPSAPPREPSVKPGINDAWRSSNITPLVGRLESESREIWTHRKKLVDVVGAKPGMVLADVGAGSGFLTLLLARKVGAAGRVFAVDINPKLLEEIDRRAKASGIKNVTTLLSEEDTTPLPSDSVDLVFMCDAYHHFEYPKSTMESIYAAVRAGGELVIVDFERIPGRTKPDMLEHVRAGKEVFRQEIVDAGFELVREHRLRELQENYILRFRRP